MFYEPGDVKTEAVPEPGEVLVRTGAVEGVEYQIQPSNREAP
jgi:hypothetical protein